MQFRPIRPPFVLCFAADQQGCGHHRIVMPASAMAAAGMIDARIDAQIWSEDWLKAVKPDVIVYQRQIELAQIDAIKLARRILPSAHLVYEIDDALSRVPQSSYHTGAVPPGVEARIREALHHCDAVSTTTEPMAAWLRELGATDVRVIPNLVTADQVRERAPHESRRRTRIGWAGGISHDGDLAQLTSAMKTIGREVDWVFFGARPPPCGVEIEYHEGVAANAYLDKLHSLDLDLVLAPLEDNFFNSCKSSLRLVEAGAIGAAVIAQAAPAYLDDAPPVVGYVPFGEDWTKAIRAFLDLPVSRRRHHGAEMQRWVAQRYTYESRIDDRLKAWLPKDMPAFRPGKAASRDEAGKTIVCCVAGAPGVQLAETVRPVGVEVQIEDAVARAMTTGADVLWMRPGTTLTAEAWRRMQEEGIKPQVATVCVLGPDGPDAFPTKTRFTPTPAELAGQIGALLAEFWPGRIAEVVVPTGAAVLIKSSILSLLGSPDAVGLGGNTEAALAEWAIKASMRQLQHIQVLDQFVGSLAGPQHLTESMATRMRLRGTLSAMQGQMAQLSDAERERLELRLVAQQWTGPRPGLAPFASDYRTWSGLRRDEPFRMAESCAVAAFGGVMPETDWVIFIDETVTLRPGAAARMIATGPEAEFIYADHEALTDKGPTPVFKPCYDRELFLARDYITPVMVCRTSALQDRVPGDRVDLYKMVLSSATWDRANVVHLPEILGLVKDAVPAVLAEQTARRARHVAALAGNATPHRSIPGAVSVQRRLTSFPSVTIVIPTLGEGWMLQPCLLPLLNLTAYPAFTVLLVQGGDREKPDIGDAAQDPRVETIRYEGPFNWSAINNSAAQRTDSDFLLFLNDDTRILTPGWLESMVAMALEPDVGVVGARLTTPQGTVQHVGVVAHQGMIGHVHFDLPIQSPGYLGIAHLSHEASAVTGACMLVSRKIYAELDGFREDLTHNYNDIAFCLEAGRAGYRNVVECRAELTHLGGASRPGPDSPEGMERLMIENAIMGRDYIQTDPYWNPNFALVANGQGVQGLGYEMLSWPGESPVGRERVLVINDTGDVDGEAARLTREGAVVFLAEASGFEIKMLAPALVVGRWDIRDATPFRSALGHLAIDRIVISSLIGTGAPAAPIETLKSLGRQAQPVSFVPRTPEVACPRLTFLQDGVACGDGWKFGAAYCQRCIDTFGSPFGFIDVRAWQDAWAEVLRLPVAPVVDDPLAMQDIALEDFETLTGGVPN